jgi:hypothetical protein
MVDLSAGGDELAVRYGGRLAGQRWPNTEVYRRPGSGSPDVLVGWLVLGPDGGSFLRFTGRPFTRREGTTHGGPGPETYPIELPPGDYRVCAEVVPRVDVTEVVCTDFSISG